LVAPARASSIALLIPTSPSHTVSQPVHITVQSLHDNLGSIGAFNQQVILVLHLTKALQLQIQNLLIFTKPFFKAAKSVAHAGAQQGKLQPQTNRDQQKQDNEDNCGGQEIHAAVRG
jgi:hypothetical protein